MAKSRSLTDFNNVAIPKKDTKKESTTPNNDINNNIDNNKNNNVNNNTTTPDSTKSNGGLSLEQVNALGKKNAKKKSDSDLKPSGIYFWPNNLALLDRLAKNGGRGTRSQIVNQATQEFFIKAGLMDEEGNIID